MPGTLYLCATPIGNLKDMTERVIETLKNADLIAAEDTRNSIKLLNHFDIHTPLTSYHDHNRFEKAEELLNLLSEGKNVALITDAGTPAISDPGEVLVKRCIETGINVTSLPGASAVITALTLSGLSTERFAFEGFLPKDNGKRKELLSELSKEKRTLVLYEAPHRLKKTLSELREAFGNRRIALCRELTKIHEEVLRMTLDEAEAYYEEAAPRGEFVLVIEGRSPEEEKKEQEERFKELSVKEHVEMYEKQGMDRKEAMKAVSKERGIPKREVYSECIKSDT